MRYWFEDISAQLQAQELFDLLRRQLRTRPLYDQLSREVGESYGRLELERQGKLGEEAKRLNRLAALGLVLAITTGIFGMNVLIPDKAPFWVDLLMIIVALGLLAAVFEHARRAELELSSLTPKALIAGTWRQLKRYFS